MRQYFFPVAVVLAILVLGACSAPAQQGPSAWLDRPLDGDQVAREPLTIQAHASDADGVSRFEFFVGETLLIIVPGNGGRFAEAQAGWVPPSPGGYIIRVRAVDGIGNTGAESIARITVSESPQPTATPTPAPAQLPTPTPVPARTSESVPDPLITFTGERTILRGECATIQWDVQPRADYGSLAVKLDGQAVGLSDQKQVCPQETTIYMLVVEFGAATKQSQVRIFVESAPTLTPIWTPTLPPLPRAQTPTSIPPPVCPGPPVISSFMADPSTITVGQSSTLNWGLVSNATSAVIDPDIGGVPTPGSQVVTPGRTTTFTLTATGCGGTTRRQVTIAVNPAPPPPTRTQPPPPPPDTTPPSISNASANPTTISQSGCGQNVRTTVSAAVTDASGVDRVVAQLSGVGGGEVPMSPVGGNVYRTDVGPFNSAGQLTIRVVAWDKAGNLAQSGSFNVSVVCIK